MIDFYFEDSIFDELFENIGDYVSNIVFKYNETGYECDYRVPTRSDVNLDVPGIYLIDDENVICDEVFSFEYELTYKDKFKLVEYDYFCDEFNHLRAIDDVWNNTIFGQYGLRLFIGNSYDKSNIICPAVYLMLYEEDNLSPLEKTGNTLLKKLVFDIGLIVSSNDVFDSNSPYKPYNFIKKFIFKTIGEYFNFCDVDMVDNITEWYYNSKIQEESYNSIPFIRGLIRNNLNYR